MGRKLWYIASHPRLTPSCLESRQQRWEGVPGWHKASCQNEGFLAP